MVQKLNQTEDPVAVDSALLQVDPLHILPGGLSARTRAFQAPNINSS